MEILWKKKEKKDLAWTKKYGGVIAQKSKITFENVTNYVKIPVPYFNKNKDNNEGENNQKEDEKKK